MKYSELLKDDRWQDCRKAILARDNYTCQECGATNTVLHVHHHFYHGNTMPWDYDNEVLITLCEICHEQEEFFKAFDLPGIHYLLTLGLTRKKISDLIGALSSRLNVEGVDAGKEFIKIITEIRNG